MEATSCVNRGSAALHRSVKLLKEFWAAIPQVKWTQDHDLIIIIFFNL